MTDFFFFLKARFRVSWDGPMVQNQEAWSQRLGLLLGDLQHVSGAEGILPT